MNIFKFIANIFYTVVITFLVVIALSTALTVFQAPQGLRLFVVQSGSMEPSIHTASVVIVMPAKEYRQGDAITFYANPNERDLKKNGTTVTHRIVKVNNDEGKINYQTKGDANEDTDREAVSHSSVLGKVIFSIPYLGRVVAFTKTQTGFIALIIIPATLIVYSELMSIFKEVKKMINNKKVKKQTVEKADKAKSEKPESEKKLFNKHKEKT